MPFRRCPIPGSVRFLDETRRGWTLGCPGARSRAAIACGRRHGNTVILRIDPGSFASKRGRNARFGARPADGRACGRRADPLRERAQRDEDRHRKTTHARWRDLVSPSFLDQVVRSSGDIDVYVISGEAVAAPRPSVGGARPRPRHDPRAYAASLAAALGATALAWVLFVRRQLARSSESRHVA